MSLLRVVTAVAVLAACGGASKRVRKPGEEYLAKIVLEGVDHLDHEGLMSGLALTRSVGTGRPIDDYQLNLDTQRIIGLYQQRGFFTATVTPRVERKGAATTLIFHVVEGPRAAASVVIEGLPPEIPYAEARALVKLENGGPFDYDAFDLAKEPLLAMVENAGYAHAQLEAQVLADRGKARATLRYSIDAGPRVTFGPITISGVSEELADAARARLPIHEGDPYSTKKLAEAQLAIHGIGRFSSERIDIDRMSDATVLPVKIVLTEAKRWEARAGGGAAFDTLTYQARLRGTLTHAGWPTPLTTLGAELRPAVLFSRDNSECSFSDVSNVSCYDARIRLIGTASQQDFLQRDLRADVEGGLDYLQLEAYTVKGERARIGLSRPFADRRIDVHVGWQFAYYKFTDISVALSNPRPPDMISGADIGVENDHPERLGAFSGTVALDYRDNPVTPHLGGYGELRVTSGGAWAAGAYDYLQLVPDLRGYVPLGRAVLAARARVGVILGSIPPTERFYAGGASSQRGFPERHLSPTASGDDDKANLVVVPIGGGGLIETGVELRVPFTLFSTDMGAAAFVDGGDVTLEASQLDPTNLHWAAGVSLRPYYLPIGPIRLDFAYRLNRTGAGNPLPDDHWAFTFSLGEAY